ncbi:MAG: PD-(D/E)XK nuclease-like domain-containing protein, partial [Thermoplasmata archaeon]
FDAVNASTLKHFAKTPAHVYHWLLRGGDDDDTPSTALGTLVHLAVLEPERFASEVVVAPDVPKRKDVHKAIHAQFEAENAGKFVTDGQTLAKTKAMARAVLSHEKAGPYFSGVGQNEISIVWDDKETGVRCKARIDRVAPMDEWPIVGDLKTDKDASPWAWGRTVVKCGYHIAAAHYLAGLEARVPIPAGSPFRRFVHFVVESEPPHCVALYELDDQALEDAAVKRRRYLRLWKACTESGIWPGYPIDVQPTSLPRWALTDSSEE